MPAYNNNNRLVLRMLMTMMMIT